MAPALLLPLSLADAPTTAPTPPNALANPNRSSPKSLRCSSFPLSKSLFPRFQIRCSYTGPLLSSSSSSGFDFEHERVVCPRPAEIPWSKELCNSVHLIGIVGTPVQIKHLSSGKVVAWCRLAVKKSATDTAWSVPLAVSFHHVCFLQEKVMRIIRFFIVSFSDIIWTAITAVVVAQVVVGVAIIPNQLRATINLTFWDVLAHVAFQHVEKGQQIYVRGRLISDTIEGDDEKRQTYYKVLLIIVVVQQLNFVERTPAPVSLYEPEMNFMTAGNSCLML
ncbi:hypothetical protein ACLOJK_026985 [Asimina triloba]